MQGIATATGEIAQMRRLDLERRQLRNRLSTAIRTIDCFLGELERLRLDQDSRLPMSTARWLGLVLQPIPTEIRPEVHEGQSVDRLVDALYKAQASLLARRSGPDREVLIASERKALESE